MKKKVFSFLYLLCLYLAATLFDLDMFKTFTIPSFVRIILFVIVLVLVIVEIVKMPIREEMKTKPLFLLFLIPLAVPCGSNIIYCLANGINTISDINTIELIEDVVRTILCAVIEELIFRTVLLDALKDYFEGSKNKEILIIITDAAAFSLMHCINFFGNAPLTVVLQLGYTLVMGLVFAALSLFAENMVVPAIAHTLFNLLNMTLFAAFFDFTSNDMNAAYIIYSAVLALISLGYAVILFVLNSKFMKKAKEK